MQYRVGHRDHSLVRLSRGTHAPQRLHRRVFRPGTQPSCHRNHARGSGPAHSGVTLKQGGAVEVARAIGKLDDQLNVTLGRRLNLQSDVRRLSYL